MFRAAVNPSLEAAGNASLRFTPRQMTSRAGLWYWRDERGDSPVVSYAPADNCGATLGFGATAYQIRG